MKRCPECHFTFEDRVQVCDFDGCELTPFADPAPLSDRIVRPPEKSKLIRLVNSRIGLSGLVVLLLVSGVFFIVRYKSSSPTKLGEKTWTVERHDSMVSTHPLISPEDESPTLINLSVEIGSQSPGPRHHAEFPLITAPLRA